AEDGIRDKLVTGVQTCALPIYLLRVFARDALLDRGLDPVLLAAGERLAGIQRSQRDVALDQLLLEDLENGLHALLGVGLEKDLQIGRASCRERVEYGVGAVSWR